MSITFTRTRVLQSIRVLFAILLVLSVIGGVGVVKATNEHNSGQHCPGDNPTQAYERASESGIVNSDEGRVTALRAAGCIP